MATPEPGNTSDHPPPTCGSSGVMASLDQLAESSRPLAVMRQVVYFIHIDVPPTKAAMIRSLMSSGGAQEWMPSTSWKDDFKKRHVPSSGKIGERLDPDPRWRFDPELVTHVITCSTNMAEYDACGHPLADGIADNADCRRATVVSPEWVFRSFQVGARQAERYFSPDPAMIFSGVVVHPSRMSAGETELMLAAVTSLGGHFRMNLTKEVTHVVTPVEDSIKLQALRTPDYRHLAITAVHPAWVNECVRLSTSVSDRHFAWPLLCEGKPACLQFPSEAPSAHMKKGCNTQEADPAQGETEEDRPSVSSLVLRKKNIDDLFCHAPDDKRRTRFYRFREAFKGLKILFVPEETLPSEMIETLSYNVKDHGGIWIPLPAQSSSLPLAVTRADIIIVSHRDTPAAYWGLYLHKRLATVAWLWWVATSGRIVEPEDNVLHFPPPQRPIQDFEHYTFSLSNYTGETRSYLKDLIHRAGAKWTPNLTPRNTHLVTASAVGEKVDRAAAWQVTVVNHLWLEACYSLWQNVPPSQDRAYTEITDTVPLQTVMGRACVHKAALEACKEGAEKWVLNHSEAEGFITPPHVQRTSPSLQAKALERTSMPRSIVIPPSQRSATQSSPLGTVPLSSLLPVQESTTMRSSPRPARVTPHTSHVSQTSKTPIRTLARATAGSAVQEATCSASNPCPKSASKLASHHASSSVLPKSSFEHTSSTSLPLRTKEHISDVASAGAAVIGTDSMPRKRKGNEIRSTSGDKQRRRSSSSGGRPGEGRRRYYATTFLDLSSAEEKALKRRGWHRTHKIEDASVLLASTLTRTEKMLCAVARGVPVVSRSWLADPSQAWETVLLSDPQAERARDVELRAAIARRRSGKPLLAGHTFLFTEHVQPSPSVLRTVVQAAGGWAPSSPTFAMDLIRQDPQTTHLVSSNEDKAVWAPLANERCADGSAVRVWNAELLLDGILRQEMRWERNRLLG